MAFFTGSAAPTGYVWDSWGWRPRNDWVRTDDNDAQGGWKISGSGIDANDVANSGQLFATAEEAIAAYGARPAPAAGVAQDENAYNASLRAQGIDPSELPLHSSGQEATARVLQQHGLAIPEYLRSFLQQAGGTPAGGGNSAVPGAFAQQAQQSMGFLQPFGGQPVQPGQVGPDVMQNSLTNKFMQRFTQDTVNQQAQQTRDMIRKLLLNGQQQKPMISPAMLAAARRPMGS